MKVIIKKFNFKDKDEELDISPKSLKELKRYISDIVYDRGIKFYSLYLNGVEIDANELCKQKLDSIDIIEIYQIVAKKGYRYVSNSEMMVRMIVWGTLERVRQCPTENESLYLRYQDD